MVPINKKFIGIDLGTSAVKLLLVDGRGQILGEVTKEYPLSFPQPGWSEQSPEDWWKAVQHGILQLTEHDIVKASRLLLTIASNKGDGIALVHKRNGLFHLLPLQL